MAIAAIAGRAVLSTLAWLFGRAFERPSSAASPARPDDLDRWLDTLHDLAERAARQRATQRGERRDEGAAF